MRISVMAVLAASLLVTPVVAQGAPSAQDTQPAQDSSQAPLAPGKSAGMTDAQRIDTTIYWVAAGALVIAAIAIPLSGGNGHSTTTTTGNKR